MNPKLQWLRNKMSSLDLQGLIISNPINIKYLTNIEAEGTLLLTRKENIYITDARYIEHVHSTLTLFDEIIVYDMNDVSREDYENFFMFCENVGFEEHYVTYAQYKEYMRKYKILIKLFFAIDYALFNNIMYRYNFLNLCNVNNYINRNTNCQSSSQCKHHSHGLGRT